MDEFLHVIKTFSFSGRASRREYWMFSLFYSLILVAIILTIAVFKTSPTVSGVLLVVFLLGLTVQSWAVAVRRLHDANYSGWIALTALIPVVGGLIFMVLLSLPGTKGKNKFGPDPYAPKQQKITHRPQQAQPEQPLRRSA